MRTTVFVSVLVVSGLVAASAEATPITDVYDPADVYFADGGAACTGTNPTHEATGDVSSGSTCASLQFTHSITPEFDPALHDLLDATLTLYFHDDESGIPESFTLFLDGSGTATATEREITSGSNAASHFAYDVALEVAPDGALLVNLLRGFTQNQNSDFYFERSVLSANYDRLSQTPAPVPEPASLVLLGTGMAGIAAGLRRRKRSPVA